MVSLKVDRPCQNSSRASVDSRCPGITADCRATAPWVEVDGGTSALGDSCVSTVRVTLVNKLNCTHFLF